MNDEKTIIGVPSFIKVLKINIVIRAFTLITIGGCNSKIEKQKIIARAQEFRTLIKEGNFEVARKLMSENARHWWENGRGMVRNGILDKVLVAHMQHGMNILNLKKKLWN